jgi:hypothetical protein
MTKKRITLAIAAAVAAVGIGTGTAVAASSITTATAPTPKAVYACEGSGHVAVQVLSTPSSRCPAGTTSIVIGAQGPAGASAILTVSAQTAVTNWPENSGWANDNYTRNVTLTREGSAPASDCGPSASQCWFYTETLADNGTFTTVDGHASPNGSSTATIKGAWTGTMTGGGKLEFYAGSGSPDPKLVPGTANGSKAPSGTTGWYKLFFPAGITYGTAPAQVAGYAPWTTYVWTYTASVTCGSANSVTEKWTDGINPGDDGQGASDGNITGATACAS